MKKLLITSVLATTLAASSVMAAPEAPQGDFGQIFTEQGKATQVQALSEKEMKATQGEWWWIVAALVATAVGVSGSTKGCGRGRC